MSSRLLDASELKDLHQRAPFSLTIEDGLAMTSATKVRDGNMPNVCDSDEYLAQNCSEQVIKGSANAHGYQ
jgi:hypothetical protein